MKILPRCFVIVRAVCLIAFGIQQNIKIFQVFRRYIITDGYSRHQTIRYFIDGKGLLTVIIAVCFVIDKIIRIVVNRTIRHNVTVRKDRFDPCITGTFARIFYSDIFMKRYSCFQFFGWLIIFDNFNRVTTYRQNIIFGVFVGKIGGYIFRNGKGVHRHDNGKYT